jgi:hypothetical protein
MHRPGQPYLPVGLHHWFDRSHLLVNLTLAFRPRQGGFPERADYKIQARTICTMATADMIIATNHSGFFFVTVQIEAVAIATVK